METPIVNPYANLKIALASDHAGLEYKTNLLAELRKLGYSLIDLGPMKVNPNDDYPDFAKIMAETILEEKAEKGILICGSAVGVSVVANKYKGIRAGVCHDTYSAHQSVEHDDVNVLCMGQRVIGIALAIEIAERFIQARFSGEERHVRRLNKLKQIENLNFKQI